MPESQLLDGDQVKIGKQIVLPLSKAIEISLKSLKIRFWRSLITMGGIILAIAFLSNILAANAIVKALRNVDDAELQQLMRKHGYESSAASWEETAETKKAQEGLSKKDAKEIWLVTLAIFVALVGIMNSMLMAVTERFREIGTMKCLGALDSFIVKLFLLESSFQGALGTMIGIVAGVLVTLLQLSVALGFVNVFTNLPMLQLLWSAALAFGVGAIVSVIGAIWPAWTAANMEPVAAMRVEA